MDQTSIDVFAKTRGHEREEQLRAAREADVLPYFRVLEGPAMPVVEMEGAERVMLGSNNYLGLTSDERVQQGAADALARYGTGLTGSRLLNGTIPLHLELEREIADWMDTEDAIVFTTGHQANVGTLGTLLGPGDTVIADSADHASILDGCLLSRAKLRPFRHNRLDKLERALERAARRRRRRPRRRRRRLLHGGRHRPAARHRRPLQGPRRAPHGRRGPRRRRPGRPRRRDRRAARRRATTSTCAWGRSRSRWPRAGGSWPGPPTSSSSCASSRARSSSPPRRCRRRWARRSPPCGSCARRTARRCSRASWRTRGACATGSRPRATRSSGRSRCRAGATSSPRSCPSWSATTGRPSCSGARSGTPASSSTRRCIRPSPGRRAAAHERHGDARRRDDRPGARRVRDGQAALRGRARPAAVRSLTLRRGGGSAARTGTARPCPSAYCPKRHLGSGHRKNALRANVARCNTLTLTPSGHSFLAASR